MFYQVYFGNVEDRFTEACKVEPSRPIGTSLCTQLCSAILTCSDSRASPQVRSLSERSGLAEKAAKSEPRRRKGVGKNLGVSQASPIDV